MVQSNSCDEQCPLRVMFGLETRETVVRQGNPLKMVGGIIGGGLKGVLQAGRSATVCPARHLLPQDWRPSASCIAEAQKIADRLPTVTRDTISPVKSRSLRDVRLHGDPPSEESIG